MRHFLMHDSRDNVGVAVVDIKASETATGVSLDGATQREITALEDVPLGHKIALKSFSAGDTIIKYGEDIGRVVAAIRAGEHVHVHNLKTKRW
ncbi:MAG: UxaA family hydrolase [Terriglobia bacterium]